MTHKLKTETLSQKIEYSGGVVFWPLTPLFSFVTFHLKGVIYVTMCNNNASDPTYKISTDCYCSV